MKVFIFLMVAFLMNGCIATDLAMQKAANTMDSIVESGEAMTCDIPSVRAIRESHCRTEEGCKRWADFCLKGDMREAWDATAEGD